MMTHNEIVEKNGFYPIQRRLIQELAFNLDVDLNRMITDQLRVTALKGGLFFPINAQLKIKHYVSKVQENRSI